MTLPPGVELNGNKLRIWFMWKGARVREPLFLDPTPKNIITAGKLRLKVVSAIQQGVFDYATFFPNKSEAKTFKVLAEIWLSARSSEVGKATRVKYRQVLDQYWLPHLGSMSLNAITPSVLMQTIALTDWSTLSPKRWNDSLIPLRAVLELAVDDGLIERNPAAKLRNRPPTPEPVEPFTLAEVGLILAKLGAMRDYFDFAFATGLRPGEQIALRWSDWSGDEILVQRSRSLGETGPTKTRKVRRHVLAPRARAVLERVPREGDVVFQHPVLGRPFHEIRPLREVWWAPALRAAELPARDLYVTRHTYATTGIMGGANPYWLARQMGTSVELIYRTYGRWIDKVGGEAEAAKMAVVLPVP